MKEAIFLIGGPGSGKDIILKEILSKYDIKEFGVEQVKRVYKKFFREILIITGNAYSLENIKNAKNILESEGYKTSLIFVDVSDKISRERLSHRNISEEVRVDRLIDSKLNINTYQEIFKDFYYFNNILEQNSIKMQNELDSLEEDLRIGSTLSDKRKMGIKSAIESLKRSDVKKHKDVSAENYAKHIKKTNKNGFAYHNKKTDSIKKTIIDFRDRLRHQSEQFNISVDEGFKRNRSNTDSQSHGSFIINPIRGSGIGPEFDMRNSGEYRLGGMLNTMASESIDSPSTEIGFSGGEGSGYNKMPLENPKSYEYKVGNNSTISKAKKIIFNNKIKKLSLLKK